MWRTYTERCVAPWEPLATALLQTHTQRDTIFYNAHFLTLTGCLCVSLLTSCAHSSNNLKSQLLAYASPSGGPQPPLRPIVDNKQEYNL